MANDVKIRFLVTENVTAATSKMDSSLKKNQAQAQKTTASIKSLQMQWIAAAAGAAALYAGVKKLTDAYMEQERAEKKLAAALRVTGQYTDETYKSMLDFASNMQELTIYGDEFVLSLEQMALNMGLSSDKAKEATRGALGLASAMGIDAKSAIKGVTTALQGDFNLLSRYIPELRTTTDETEKLAILNKTLAQSFGVAEAEANTFSGIVEQNSNLLGDVKEKLGEIIAIAAEEPLKGLNTGLRDTNTILENVVVGFKKLTKGIGEIKDSSPLFRAALKSITASLIPGVYAVGEMSGGMHALADGLRTAQEKAATAKELKSLMDSIGAGTEQMRGMGDEAFNMASSILSASVGLKRIVEGGGINYGVALGQLKLLNEQVQLFLNPPKPTGAPSPVIEIDWETQNKRIAEWAELATSTYQMVADARLETEQAVADAIKQHNYDMEQQYIAGAEVFANAFEGAIVQSITGAEKLGKALEKAIVAALAQIAAKMAVSGLFKLLGMIPGVGNVFSAVGGIMQAGLSAPASTSGALATPSAVVIENYTASPFSLSSQESGKEFQRAYEKITERQAGFNL